MLGAASVGRDSRSYVELKEDDGQNGSSKNPQTTYGKIHPSQIRGINRHKKKKR